MNVTWNVRALEDLRELIRYIARDNINAARQMADRIQERTEKLGRLPETGRRVPETTGRPLREVIVKPYRIVYWVRDDEVRVLSIFHGARRFPNLDDRD